MPGRETAPGTARSPLQPGLRQPHARLGLLPKRLVLRDHHHRRLWRLGGGLQLHGSLRDRSTSTNIQPSWRDYTPVAARPTPWRSPTQPSTPVGTPAGRPTRSQASRRTRTHCFEKPEPGRSALMARRLRTAFLGVPVASQGGCRSENPSELLRIGVGKVPGISAVEPGVEVGERDAAVPEDGQVGAQGPVRFHEG